MRVSLSFNRDGSNVIVRFISAVLVFCFVLSPAQPAFAAFGDGTPTVPNPTVFTAADAPKVNGQSGAFTQRVPLDIPPGRNGLQPDVSLQYNSELVPDATSSAGIAPSTNPTIMDTTTPTVHAAVNTTSQSFTYNVPSGGTNKGALHPMCETRKLGTG
jgi:hypothetical protein